MGVSVRVKDGAKVKARVAGLGLVARIVKSNRIGYCIDILDPQGKVVAGAGTEISKRDIVEVVEYEGGRIMSDYTSVSRTNYFRVTDEAKLLELAKKVNAEIRVKGDGAVALWGKHGIGQYFDEKTETDVEIYNELQGILPKDEAIILIEIGHEKADYLVGTAMVITKTGIESLDIEELAVIKATEMLGVDKLFRLNY